MPLNLSPARIVRLFGRAVRLHCPNCGKAKLFQSWFRMQARCPVCHLPTERGDHGYQVGSYMFNIIASELAFAAVFLAIVLTTWPDPPWLPLQIGGVAMMIVAPFVLYPFSKTVFLAFDLVFRPATAEELRP